MHKGQLRWVTTASAAFIVTASYASFANGANPRGQVVPAGFLDASVRILGTQGSGSGAVYHNERIGDYRYLCLVTADHVERGNAGLMIGFEGNAGTGGQFSINPVGNSNAAVFLGGPTGNVDMAFIGVRMAVSDLTAAQETYLSGVSAFNLSVSGITNTNLTAYGYGRSGAILTDSLGGNTQVGFRDRFSTAANAYGTHRFVNQTTTNNYNFNDGFYQYSAMEWTLDMPGQAGEGQVNSGDSGGAIVGGGAAGNIGGIGVFKGDLIGITTYSESEDLIENNVKVGEDFLYGTHGGGVRFTQSYVDWLNQRCDAFAAPEPGTIAAIGLGLAALLGRRRRHKA